MCVNDVSNTPVHLFQSNSPTVNCTPICSAFVDQSSRNMPALNIFSPVQQDVTLVHKCCNVTEYAFKRLWLGPGSWSWSTTVHPFTNSLIMSDIRVPFSFV